MPRPLAVRRKAAAVPPRRRTRAHRQNLSSREGAKFPVGQRVAFVGICDGRLAVKRVEGILLPLGWIDHRMSAVAPINSDLCHHSSRGTSDPIKFLSFLRILLIQAVRISLLESLLKGPGTFLPPSCIQPWHLPSSDSPWDTCGPPARKGARAGRRQ